MDKYFVCLANSYKHGGRCIAGIEVQVTSAGYNVVRENGRPKWIRPICRYTDAGAIPNEIALNLQLFAIIRMTNVVSCPAGAQSENAFFDELQPIGVSFDESKIDECLVDNSRTTLFFNHGKAVVPDVYNRLGDHSVLLIKASDAEIYGDTTYTDYPRYRVRFNYHSYQYDLPITDPWYIHDIRDGKKTPGQKGDIFITCSLGVEHEGWHPKLAACIIENTHLDTSNIESLTSDWNSLIKCGVLSTGDFTEGVTFVTNGKRWGAMCMKTPIVPIKYDFIYVDEYEYGSLWIVCGKEVTYIGGTEYKGYFDIYDFAGKLLYEGMPIYDNKNHLINTTMSYDCTQYEKKESPIVKEKSYSVEEIRRTHVQAYAKWTPEADAELAKLFDMNWSIKQLMEHFGRNDGAIRSRLKKIGKTE